MSKLSKNPVFYLDLGPMCSGKTSELVRRCSKMADALASVTQLEEKEKVKHVLFITYKSQETREVKSYYNGITSHSTNLKPSKFLKIRKVDRLSEITNEELEDVDFIGIDEAFYPDFYEKVYEWYWKKKISISIASIDGSFTQKVLCEQLNMVLPFATKICKHSAYCYYCLKDGKIVEAYYTDKTDGDLTKEEEYGGIDKYKPVCFNHIVYKK